MFLNLKSVSTHLRPLYLAVLQYKVYVNSAMLLKDIIARYLYRKELLLECFRDYAIAVLLFHKYWSTLQDNPSEG